MIFMILKQNILNKRGLKLSTIFEFPDQRKRFPAIILLQGFLGKKDGEKVASFSNYLKQIGFAAARFDPAGFGESDGKTIDEYFTSNILDDLESIYKALLVNDFVDKAKISIWGQSMGGMLAIIFAAKHPEIKSICVVSPPAQITKDDDLEKILSEWENRGFLLRQNSEKQEIKISYDFVKDVQRWNAEDFVFGINGPILIISGSKDTTVPVRVSRNIFSRAKLPKEFIEIPGMSHDYKENSEHLRIINQLSGDFFLKNLK